jgi:hypothetical protein
MKKNTFFVLFIITLFSCSKEAASTATAYQGKWKLTQMTGMMANSETSGSTMEWQEFYVLDSNGRFKKSRERNGVITEISGSYSLSQTANGTSLLLSYKSDSEIIGSCSSALKEELYFESESVLFSTWQQCDGPGLKYEKVD